MSVEGCAARAAETPFECARCVQVGKLDLAGQCIPDLPGIRGRGRVRVRLSLAVRALIPLLEAHALPGLDHPRVCVDLRFNYLHDADMTTVITLVDALARAYPNADFTIDVSNNVLTGASEGALARMLDSPRVEFLDISLNPIVDYSSLGFFEGRPLVHLRKLVHAPGWYVTRPDCNSFWHMLYRIRSDYEVAKQIVWETLTRYHSRYVYCGKGAPPRIAGEELYVDIDRRMLHGADWHMSLQGRFKPGPPDRELPHGEYHVDMRAGRLYLPRTSVRTKWGGGRQGVEIRGWREATAGVDWIETARYPDRVSTTADF